MNVLIADDEPMTRSLLRRVLARDCGCTVMEATDGLEALSIAGSTPPDLIITDLRMPVMDGIELIVALRQVPALAAIPVVMMTAARDQGPVHRAIELGVLDYLLKPLQADRVAERMRSVLDRVTRLAEEDRSPVLVADGNAEFRQFVALTLGPHRSVRQAQTGVAALQSAVEMRPGTVIVGGELGLLGPELLMRKLRAASELAGTRILAVVPKDGSDPATMPDHVDGVITRTLVADDFRAQFGRFVARDAAADGVLAAHPSLRAQVASAAEQVFGMMLQLDVQHSFEVQPRPVPQLIDASLAIDLPDTSEVLTIALRTDLASAARIAAGMARTDTAPASDEEGAVAAAADVLTIIAGRIKTGLETSGARLTMHPPTRQIGAGGDLSEGAAGQMQVAVQTADGGIQFVLLLSARPASAERPLAMLTADPAPAMAPAS